MDRRDFNGHGKPARSARAGSSSAQRAAVDPRLDRAQLLIECTRAVLRAREEAELAATLCSLLVHPGFYAEACISLTGADGADGNRCYYAGSDKQCAAEPQRYWTSRPRKAVFERALAGKDQPLAEAAAGSPILPLRAEGRIVGVLALATEAARRLEPDEIEQLSALAEDVSCAIARLRAEAPHRGLALSERRLRETFDHAGLGITRIDMNGRFIEVNQKFCEMLGYTRDELVGRPTRDFTVPEDFGPGPVFRAQAQLGRATLLTGEKRYVRKDGSYVWVRRTMSAARDVNGQVRDGISVVEDITERKVAEEAARSERHLLRTIIDAVPHYIYVKDLDGCFTLVNEAWLDNNRLAASEAQGKTVHDLFPPALAAQMEAQDRLVLAGAPVLDTEHWVALDGGPPRCWATTKVPLRDAAGRIVGLVGISRDVSESKGTEEAIRRERALLRTIIDALPDYIHVKDAQGHIQLGNLAWLRGRRVLDSEVRGKTVFDIFPPALAQRMEAQDQEIIASGVAMIENEQPVYVLDDGGNPLYRWSSTTKVPMRDDAGNIIGVVGISRDITDRRRMERERAMEHAVSRVLSESRSVGDTMPRLIRTVCEAMNWTYGAHWTWDSASGALRRAAWWCEFEPHFEPEDALYWTQIDTPHTTGLLGKAWIEQRATWMTDVAQMQGFRRVASCAKFGFRSAFAFPILAHEEPVGVIEFFGRELREPDEALLQVSGAISAQIGQFIRRKQAEESLQENELQLRAMFENADVGIAMTGVDMGYLRVNDKYCDIVGYARDELLRMRASEVNLESNVEAMRGDRERMMSGESPGMTVEKQLVRADGSLVWVSLATSLVRAADGAPRYFIAVIQDISENKRAAEALKQSEEQFRVLAHYDILTALPNRALFYDRLSQALAQARRNRWWLAVMFIDVDRFKHVNDTFGHSAGDQLLKQVSVRLSECVRSDDTVGRLSGDEFAIVLSHLSAPVDAATVAKKIVDELNRPFQLEGTELFVTVSIGVTVFPTDTVDQDTLIRNADVAMYRAKDRGRNNYQFYTPEMNRRTREMLNMEGELRRALERDEFVLHYQPKVSLADGRVTGVEALLRWRHPERGLVPPSEFIPLLEETGLVVQAGAWVLRAVCRQLAEWRDSGLRLVPIAVNLSARQFLAPDLGESIKHILELNGLAPSLLEVEITESAIMGDTEEANRTLEYLEALGVKSAIDDFGTGYSSLGYLKRFPLGALKVDRSFVSDITTDPDDAHITQAVISMAHSLGLKVIAEGVETEEQLAFLLRYECNEVQGYLFSRPLPAEECAAAIAGERRFAAIIDSVRGR